MKTVSLLSRHMPALRFAAPMASQALRPVFEAQIRRYAPGADIRIVDGRAREVMAASEVLLVSSGTATLEAMLVGRPMVVAYRLSPLTYGLARSLNLVRVRHFSLPNLLADKRVVPEFLQGEARASTLASTLIQLLESPSRQQAMRQRFAEIGETLRRGASEAAARAVLDVAGRSL